MVLSINKKTYAMISGLDEETPYFLTAMMWPDTQLKIVSMFKASNVKLKIHDLID
jgi:hypothetical protein